ncbi:MAG: hypothetical protein AB1489_34985 [Acidobacteriota bacterium]
MNSEIVENLDGSFTHYTYIEPNQETMQSMVEILFERHWRDIVVGPCIEGAVFEVRFSEPPKTSMLDGYLTVDLGHWHFHLCIGEHRGTPSAELARKRRVSRVAFFETRSSKCGGGRSWGLRLWNGFNEQMITVFLPSPFLSDERKFLKEPKWERLKLWYELRHRFLGEPIPEDINRLID